MSKPTRGARVREVEPRVGQVGPQCRGRRCAAGIQRPRWPRPCVRLSCAAGSSCPPQLCPNGHVQVPAGSPRGTTCTPLWIHRASHAETRRHPARSTGASYPIHMPRLVHSPQGHGGTKGVSGMCDPGVEQDPNPKTMHTTCQRGRIHGHSREVPKWRQSRAQVRGAIMCPSRSSMARGRQYIWTRTIPCTAAYSMRSRIFPRSCACGSAICEIPGFRVFPQRPYFFQPCDGGGRSKAMDHKNNNGISHRGPGLTSR